MLDKIQDAGFSLRTRPLCCCCLCCPVLPPTRRSLIIVRVMIFQTVILMPIIQFISAVLWADDQYLPGGMDFTQSYIYLTIFKVASTITAIYGVNAMHDATHSHLRTFNTAPKRLALVLVQTFFNIQGVILLLLGRYDVLGCHNDYSSYFQMLQWHHLVLIVEMFLLSVLARLYYRRPLQLDAILEERHGDISVIYARDGPNPANELGYSEGIDNPELPQDVLVNAVDEVTPRNEDGVNSVVHTKRQSLDEAVKSLVQPQGIDSRGFTQDVEENVVHEVKSRNTRNAVNSTSDNPRQSLDVDNVSRPNEVNPLVHAITENSAGGVMHFGAKSQVGRGVTLNDTQKQNPDERLGAVSEVRSKVVGVNATMDEKKQMHRGAKTTSGTAEQNTSADQTALKAESTQQPVIFENIIGEMTRL